MKQNKLKQPQALLAGSCMLLGSLLWHVCSGLPAGYVSIIATIEELLEFYSFEGFLDCLLWALLFFAGVFSAIALFKADYKLSAVALFVFGGLFLAYDILCFVLWFTPRYLLELIPHTAFILAGLTVLKRSKSLRTVAVIAAAAGFLADLIFRLLVLKMQLNNIYSSRTDSQIIAWIVIVIFANLFLMLGLILACLAVDYGVRPAARGASFTPNMRQPQQTYEQPYMPYAGQPQQPYGQPYMPYAGQPQQPYGGQWQQPYPGQPQPSAQSPTFAGMPQQPFAGQAQQPFAGQAQPSAQPSPFAAQPQQTFAEQPQPDVDLEDKTQILPDDDFPETDPTVIL